MSRLRTGLAAGWGVVRCGVLAADWALDEERRDALAGRVPDKRHLQVVCAIIERDGRVLVAQRSRAKSQGGRWEFPGGKLDEGESPQEALAREIREETGAEIGVGRALSPSIHDYGAFSITLHPFLCAILSGEPVASEHEAIAWCAPGELGSLDWAGADVPIVQEYLRSLDRKGGPG